MSSGETREPVARRRRKAARPGEILDAGLAEFAENGFAAARLEDVARRAGISKGTIYLYFASKEALFEAAIRDRMVSMIDTLSGDMAAFGGSTETLLAALLGQIYERVTGPDVVLIKVLIAESQRSPDLSKTYFDTVIVRGLALIETIIARGIERGEVRDGPAAREPRVVLGPAIMAAVWTLVFERHAPLDRDAFIAAHLDLVRAGLLKRSD